MMQQLSKVSPNISLLIQKILLKPKVVATTLKLIFFYLTGVVVWLVATLTGDTDVGCWTVRICCPSATLTGSVTDF